GKMYMYVEASFVVAAVTIEQLEDILNNKFLYSNVKRKYLHVCLMTPVAQDISFIRFCFVSAAEIRLLSSHHKTSAINVKGKFHLSLEKNIFQKVCSNHLLAEISGLKSS